jgi:hypothetical protein
MSQKNLVQRMIAFLKKPDSLEYDRQSVRNAYDDFEPRVDNSRSAEGYDQPAVPRSALAGNSSHSATHASRLDAVVMRAIQQFNAQQGFVMRYEATGRMQYCTGRDMQGRYVSHHEADPDRRAVYLAVDSGEPQLFVQNEDQSSPNAILCGPLWANNEVIGVLYLDNPTRSRLHRGVFNIFCEQVGRMLNEGMA